MEELTRQAETSLSKFSYALDQLEHSIRPVLKAIDELRATGSEDDLDPMSRARMHISLCYAVNSLFCMYLRAQGVDPATHPVSDDIARVQEAFMRMRRVEAGLSADHQPMPDRDRRRHIVNTKKSAQKLASLVFPEEVDLLSAIRGKKRRKETMREGKEKKIRTEGKPSVSPKGSEVRSSDDEKESATRDTRQKESEDSYSDEERGVKSSETLGNQEREETKSPGEDFSRKKKKKKKSKKKSKHSKLNSQSKTPEGKKEEVDRTPSETKRSEEKRKRKKKAEKRRSK